MDGFKKIGVNYCHINVSNDIGSTCTSAVFSTNGTSYQRVCGRAAGYQMGETLALHGDSLYGEATIDTVYADGLLITYGSPCQHIWSYTAGSFDNHTGGNLTSYNCPCAVDGGTCPPSFVGTDYHCESGATDGGSYNSYFFDDPLWDGSGCITSRCCNNCSQPWFSKDLGGATTSDIEARLYNTGETFRRLVVIVELELMYVQ